MTNFVYFISVTYLKDNTPINENVDDKLLKSAIKEAQEIYVRDIIGSGVYNELLDQAYNGTLTVNNQLLLDSYIAPCLKYYTLTESLLPMTFKMLNKTYNPIEKDREETPIMTIDIPTQIPWGDEKTLYWRMKID